MFIERLSPDQRPELVAPEPRPCSRSEYDNGVSSLHGSEPAHCLQHASADGSRLIGDRIAVGDLCPCVNVADLQILCDIRAFLEHASDDPAHPGVYRLTACEGDDLSRLHIVSYFDSGLDLSRC